MDDRKLQTQVENAIAGNGEHFVLIAEERGALDASRFFGIWGDMDEPTCAFAYVDGKLYTLNLSKGDVLP